MFTQLIERTSAKIMNQRDVVRDPNSPFPLAISSGRPWSASIALGDLGGLPGAFNAA